MKVYKVVKVENGKKYSVVGGSQRIEYKDGEWIVPSIKNSKLFAFDSLVNGLNFAGTTSDSELWECEAADIDNHIKPVVESIILNKSAVEDYWTNNKAAYYMAAPIGTVFCSAIKLEKFVPITSSYYKIVEKRHGDVLTSIYGDTKEAAVVYKPNKWVIPKVSNSKLFVFDNANAAFASNELNKPNRELWACDVVHPIKWKEKQQVLFVSKLTVDNIETYWANLISNYRDGINPASGTSLCSAVKLTTQI